MAVVRDIVREQLTRDLNDLDEQERLEIAKVSGKQH